MVNQGLLARCALFDNWLSLQIAFPCYYLQQQTVVLTLKVVLTLEIILTLEIVLSLETGQAAEDTIG